MITRKGVKFFGSERKFNEIKKYDKKTITPVNHFNSGRLDNLVSNFKNTTFYHGGIKKAKTKELFSNSDKANIQVLNKLREKDFFSGIETLGNLPKKQTGSELFKKVIKYNKEHNIVTNKSNSMGNLINFNKLYESANKTNKIISNGGHIISFDLETLSGVNKYGHDVLSHITELSATIHNIDPVTKTMKKVKTVDSVLGFDEKEVKEAKELLNRMFSKDRSTWSNEEKVFYERMNIYGNTRVKASGFEQRVIESKGIEDIVTSKQQALKGIELFERIGKEQKAWMSENNIKVDYKQYKTNYIEDFTKLLANGEINGKTYDNFITVGHNISNFDIEKLGRVTKGKYSFNHLDTLQLANYVQQEMGRNALYDTRANRPKGVGPATQYSLAEAHGLKIKGAAAHIARNDQEENARLLVQGMFKNVDELNKEVSSGVVNISEDSYFNKILFKNLKQAKENLDRTSAIYTGADQIYYMDYTMQKSLFNANGSLSFEYNPITNEYKTFNGFNIAKNVDGAIENSGYNAFGPRKGALYQHEIFKVDVTDKFREQFMDVTGIDKDQANKIFQQYSNAKELYVVKSKEYIDLKALEKKLGSKEAAEFYYNNRNTSFVIETNVDRLGANLGVNVANIKDGNIEVNSKTLRGLDFKITSGNVGDVLVERTDSTDANKLFGMLVDKSTDRTINDSAARKVREANYSSIMRMRNYQKQIKAQGENNIITHLSSKIARGEAIKLTDNQEIINALGWMDLESGNKKIVSETLKNTVAMDSYIEQISPLIDSIDQVLDEVYGKLDISTPEKLAEIYKNPSKKELLWKREIGFKHLLDEYLERATYDSDVIKSFKNGLHASSELNKIDFNLYDINPKEYMGRVGTRVGNEASEIVSIDLNNPNSLINTFFNSKFNNVQASIDRNGNASFDALKEAYDFLRADVRFQDESGNPLLFNNISAFKNGKSSLREAQKYNVTQLADEMMQDLTSFVKKQRESNESFGLLNPRKVQNILGSNELGKIINSRKDTILDEVRSLSNTLPKDFKLLTNGIELAKDDLVNNYFLNFSFEDLDLSGFTNQQKSYIRKQYDIAKRTAETKADDLLKSIKGTNVRLGITNLDKGPALSLFEGNKVTHLDEMFRFSHNKGLLSYVVGENEYALRLGFGREYGKSKEVFSLTNTVEKIIAGRKDTKNVEWGLKEGRTISESIKYNAKQTAKNLRDSSARLELSNGQLFSQSFAFDINELVYSLPDLLEADEFKLSDIEAKYNIEDDARKAIRRLADNIKREPGKFRMRAFEGATPMDVNYFTSYYMMPLIDELKNHDEFFDKETREALSGLSYKGKNRPMWSGFISGTNNLYMDPLGAMDDDGRPPVTQMGNARLYDSDKVEKDLKKLKELTEDSKTYNNVKFKPVYTSDLAEKFMYDNVSSAGTTSTTGLTMKYMQIDTYNLRRALQQDIDLGKDGNVSKFVEANFEGSNIDVIKEKFFDRMKSLSTYEQQSSMDARVHDIAFHRTNNQTINARKKLITEHIDNLEVIKELDKSVDKLHFTIDDKGQIKYEIGINVKKGDILGTYGNTDFHDEVVAKRTGVFRGRYFDNHGNVVSEENINRYIKSTGLTDNEDILKALDKKFDFKYEVLGMEEDHGVKVFLGASEKTTVDSMKFAIGEIDEGVKKQLQTYGYGDVVGKVLKKDYMDEVLFERLRKDGNIKNAEALIEAILKERYAFSDAIHNIGAFKDVNFITALDVTKHSSATSVMHNFLNTLQDRGQITEDNMKEVFGEGNFKIIGKGTEARVVLDPSLDKVNLRFEEGSELYKALNDSTAIDIDGVVIGRNSLDAMKKEGFNIAIGHTGQGHFVTVLDDSAGTSATTFENLEKQYNKISRQLNKINKEEDPDMFFNLRNKKIAIENRMAMLDNQKGVKFSEAMGRNLDRQIYNIDAMKPIYDHYKDIGKEDEFFKTFGHAIEKNIDGSLTIKDDYVGKSLTAPITDKLRNQFLIADNDILLSEIKAGTRDYERYGYLVEAVQENGGDLSKLSATRAESLYSYGVGTDAMKVNEAKDATAIVQKLTNRKGATGFNLVDFSVDNPEWLDLQTAGQGNTVTASLNNPYTNNTIIKTGLGGENEYLAIPRLPEVHAGDNLVVKKHVSELQGLQDKFMNLKNAGTEAERDDIIEKINVQINRIKKQQGADITGKDGIVKNMMEFRMDQSFMGKGSGAIMIGIDEAGNNLFGAGNSEILDKLNSSIFRNAVFNGKTLNQHYADGAMINSIFMSEDVFRNMGYFDEDYLSKTFSGINGQYANKLKDAGFDLATKEGQEGAMRHLLSTEGDAFIGVRYPEIMMSSDKINMGYLDNTLKGNEVRVTGPGGMSAKLDFDGDQYNIARIKTTTGESRINAVIGENISDELVGLKRATDTSITTAAITDNAYWERKVQKFMTGKKGEEILADAMNIEQIARHKTINGVSYMGSVDKSTYELSQLFVKYRDAGVLGSFNNDDELIKAINDMGGNLDDYVAAKSYSDNVNMIVAKVYQNAVGESNVTNQRIKGTIAGLLDKTADDFEYKSTLMYDFLYQAEEAAISSKSSIEGLTPERAKTWNTSVTNLLTGVGNKQEELTTMRNWLNENVADSLFTEVYYAKSNNFREMVKKDFNINSIDELSDFMKTDDYSKLKNRMVDDIVDTIDGFSGNEKAINIFESLKVGTAQNGVSRRRAQDLFFIKGQETNLSKSIMEGVSQFGYDFGTMIDPSMEDFSNGRVLRESIDNIIEDAGKSAGKVSTEEKVGGIIKGIGEFARNASKGSLAKGAIGVAAGIMIAGYVGGRPRPADVHAMEESVDQAPMEGYSLADPTIMQSNGQGGYVININAKTNKGKDNAVQALQQVMASGSNSSINIAMNITDNYGNINDRAIEDAIMGAF